MSHQHRIYKWAGKYPKKANAIKRKRKIENILKRISKESKE